MVMQLRRSLDNSLISDKIFFFDGWIPDYADPELKTVNNVTYLQERGRMEWVAPVTFMFCNELSTSPISKMYSFIRQARKREWFKFTDKYGVTYDVRVKKKLTPERDNDSPQVAIFYLEAQLLAKGFE